MHFIQTLNPLKLELVQHPASSDVVRSKVGIGDTKEKL